MAIGLKINEIRLSFAGILEVLKKMGFKIFDILDTNQTQIWYSDISQYFLKVNLSQPTFPLKPVEF